MVSEEEHQNKIEGQRRFQCLIIGCPEMGRILGKFAQKPLTYCPKHRKKGERILNYLVNSLMRYRLTNFLQDSRQQLFMDNHPKLCQGCYDNLAEFVNTMMLKLDEMEKKMPLDEVDSKAPEEFVDAQ